MIGLSSPISNAESERGFSSVKFILDEYRSVLSNNYLYIKD